MNENEAANERALEHSWHYFELHAGQRMALFNFYLVLSGLVAAGLATSFQVSSDMSVPRMISGVLLAIISIIFWQLDRRVSFLVKHSEEAIAALEIVSLPQAARLFGNEGSRLSATNDSVPRWCYLCRVWTYGHCFRWVFWIMGCFGIGVAMLP